jgi:hypothetical protein
MELETSYHHIHPDNTGLQHLPTNILHLYNQLFAEDKDHVVI